MYGDFWSVTKFKDIMHVETHPEIYSSEAKLGGISITDRPMEFRRSSFISMDPPRHDEQRKVVSPIVAPANLNNMSAIIRERTGRVLDGLPRNETFDWVQHVSIELTTLMLATLFDFPVEDRAKLTYWSDRATEDVNAGGIVNSEAKRLEILSEARAGLHRHVARTRRRAAGLRPDLDAGARRGDEEPGQRSGGVPGQPDAADRRRQRHHPQLHERRAVRRCASIPASTTSCAPIPA